MQLIPSSTATDGRLWRCLALIAGLSLAAWADGQIRWRSAPPTMAVRLSPDQLTQRLAQLAARPDARHAIVQFARPVTRAERQALEQAGVRLLSYLGDHAYFAALRTKLDAAAAVAAAPLTLAEPIRRVHKLHPDLVAGKIQPWMVVDKPAVEVKEGQQSTQPRIATGEPVEVAVYVLLHRDVPRSRGIALVQRHGGRVVSQLRSVHGLVVTLPYAQIRSLADEDAVMWIEPPLPKFSPVWFNDSNRARVQADAVHGPPYGLDGTGVTVLVYDAGQVLATHPDLTGRVTIGPSDGDVVISHATHVAGTIGGTGAASGGTYAGMAPGVSIISYSFEQPGGLQPGFLYTDPGDLEADYTEALNMFGAEISNNSIGSNVESNGFDCTWQGDYGVTAALIDAIARGSLGTPYRIVWAAGNERQGSRCDVEGYGDYYSIAPPGAAKNHISVGALNSNDDSMTSFSSWGPTDDGRLKPDVAAPGCQSNDDGGVTSCNSSGGYSTFCGTSMASPTTCGVGALLLQGWHDLYPNEPDPLNSTLKVILAHTAVDLGNPGPDYQYGYGSIRAPAAAELLFSGNVLESEVDQGQVARFVVVVNPGDPELKVTLAWDDEPAVPNVIPSLVNDLDLVVYSPSGTRYYPWTLDPTNPGAPAVQTAEDHTNNMEQVFVANPEAGGWLIEVHGTNVPAGPQPFSLAGEPTLVNCSSAGTASLSAGKYPCSATAVLTVVDCDLNTSDAVVDTVDVTIASDSEPGGETVTLTETAPESASFIGSITLSQTDAPGVLLIAEGDTVTLTYIDADDGQGNQNVPVTATATIDCTPPVITGVNVTNIEPRSATVVVETDEPAFVTVRYGTDCGQLVEARSSTRAQTQHEINLSGLNYDTTYFFAVDAVDEATNATTDDNGGSCYTFGTPDVPLFFTEEFPSGNDLPGSMATFVPNGTIDFYAGCIEPLPVPGQLPTDPTGGTSLGLTDDSYAEVTLTGGQTVSFYGVTYTSFFVGSNGYITFGAGDTDYSESLSDHFRLPRISGWFDDLNPSSGGTVSYKQLSDRVAVTWENVPEFSATGANTFQVELFFDGTIRIAWADMTSGDGIAGLSEGNGLDPDFFPMDLTNDLGSCGPRPPSASNSSVQTPVGQPVMIELIAGDDGLPDPPGALTYIIDTLPDAGTLNDPNAGPITSVPYTLAGGGRFVEYVPPPLFQGGTSFTWHANDGGTPPDGGDSNIATVSITVGGPQVVYEFLVDDTDPGWSTEGQWAFGQPTGGGSHNGDPTSGFTGNNVYGYNLFGDYPNNMGVEYLTTRDIDCSNLTQVSVEFYRWLGVESSTWDHASFEATNDGVNWVTVWEHTGGAISDSSWTFQSFDISAIADNQPLVRLRWGMGPTDGSVTYPGWNIDDIVIKAVVPIGCPGDINGDGQIDLDDLSILLSNFGNTGAGPTDGDIDGDGDVDLTDLSLMLDVFGTQCQ